MCRSRRVALVLRQHDDRRKPRVDEVREHEVDQPVDAAERHRRLGPVGGQRHQPLALAAGQHDPQNLVRHVGNLPPRARIRRPPGGGDSEGSPLGYRCRSCESRCSPANTRLRSTAVLACTSNTLPASCAGSSTSRCTASASRARSLVSSRISPTRRCSSSEPTRRSSRCRPTSLSPARPATPTSCTHTPGTRTSPATSPSCSKTRRTS